jgi:NAD(P)H-hydrate epimerase
MRNPDTTKHDYGHALIVAGAYGRMGCAILAARAALRSGCGLVSVHLPSRCVDAMQAAFPEAMVSVDPSPTLFSVPPELGHYTAIAVGPGIGTDPATAQALQRLLAQRPMHVPLVLDADALNILAKEIQHSTFNIQHSILTPHAREYQRLFGDADPAEMAVRHGVTIVKKAHRTRIYTPDGQQFENQTGNAGMATAGSGDVLTGILVGMLSANILHASQAEIVRRAVEIHGQIGDIAIEKQSQSSLIASDMVENLRLVSTDISTD